MENLIEAFSLFLTFQNFLVIFIGVLIGTIIGAIPGMTTPMGVALALPFTFSMQPVTGILLLLGVYKGGYTADPLRPFCSKHPEPRRHHAPCSTAFPWPKKARRAERWTWPYSPLALRTLFPIFRSSC